MSKFLPVILATMTALLAGPVAHAKLPAPTAEQQAVADAKKAKEAETAKVEAEKLAQVQDRIAARFGKGPSAGAATAGQTEPSKVPQKAVEAPNSTGPQGGTSPSAEAHSGEAARH